MATPVTSTSTSFDPFLAQNPFITSKDKEPLDCLLPGYHLVNPNAEKGSRHAVFTEELENSPNDDRAYRLIMLENGLEVLLISDPKTDKAAAAMDVKVGHLSDPEDLQGLAHFCEHLMFMGTAKYPGENEYTEYLSQNAGSSNAFTGLDQTCYYFDVHPTALDGALDRFAQFFISPLFDPSCTEREANAVDSENAKNLQSDMWRMFQLDKSTSSREHSFWRFGTGNKKTLWEGPKEKGVDVRGRLIEWKEKFYSANVMKLAVLGKDSLDDLTKTIVSQFSPIINKRLTPPTFSGSPLTAAELSTTILLKSVRDQRLLELTFPFLDEAPLFATKPGSFLSHLIGHEGPGSILSYLKKKGWANSVSAGAGNGATGFEFFKVLVDLTKEGLEHYEEVSSAVFRYIALIRSTPPQKWAFDEVNQLSSIAFRFKEKSSPTRTAMGLSLQMSKPYPRRMLLSAPYKTGKWDPELIVEAEEMLESKNCRMMLASQEIVGANEYDKKEEWYGTEYTIMPTSDKIVKGIEADDYHELVLPKPNTFIPTSLDIKKKVEVAEPAKRPLSLRNTPTLRLWHKKDDRWWVPRAGVFFLLRSPLIDSTPLNALSTRFFTELVKDSLNEYSYDADLAGLSYNFDSQGDGILVTVDGYNDKMPVLAKVVFEKIRNLEVNPKRFDIIKDQLRRAFINWRLEQPYQHAAFAVGHLTTELLWTQEDRLAVLDEITPASLQSHITDMLGRMHIECLVHGNILKDEAIDLAKLVEKTLHPSPLTPDELKSHRALVVPEGKWLARHPVSNPDNVNSSLEQFTYIGDVSNQEERVRLSLFATMVQDPLFDQLRTKEQLGYIVSSGPRNAIGFSGLRVIVQSERNAAYLETRIDAFWEEYKSVLDKMPEEDFEKYKTTVVNQKLEDHKNMWQESSHLWINIHAGYYDFTQNEKDAEMIKTLTKQDIITFFHTYFFDSPKRPIRRLSVHLQAQRIQAEALLSLAPAIAELDIPLDPAQMETFAASKPTLAAVKKFSTDFLKAAGKDDATVSAYLEKVDALATPPPLPEGVHLIKDADEFRSSCDKGPCSVPVAEYSDLFPAGKL